MFSAGSENKISECVSELVWFNPLQCFFGSEGHVALDRNPGPGYDTLLLRIIPGDLLSAFPHRQFHTLPGLLDSWAALPNSNPKACMPMQGGSLYHFYDGIEMIDWLINPLECYFRALKGCNTLLLQLIPGDLYSACTHRQVHTLPGFLHSQTALSNSYPNVCVPNREVVCTIVMIVFTVTQLGHEPMTYHMRHRHAKPISHPDAVFKVRGPFVQTLCIEKDSYMDAI